MPGLIPIMVGCVFYLFSVIIIIECISKYAGLSLSSRTQCLMDEQCDDIIFYYLGLPACGSRLRSKTFDTLSLFKNHETADGGRTDISPPIIERFLVRVAQK
jgi:hypothetical protein